MVADAVAEVGDAKSHYGASEIVPGSRARRVFPLAADSQGVVGFDSPDVASDWSVGRFIQKDPPVERRPRHHYSYASNSPVSNTDPSGERTFVRVDQTSKTIYVMSLIAVTSDEGLGDVSEVASAGRIAGRLFRDIDEYWNNGGLGWMVTMADGAEYTLYFRPQIWSVSEDIFKQSVTGFEDFDRIDYVRSPEGTAVWPKPGATAGADYNTIPGVDPVTDPKRGIPEQAHGYHYGRVNSARDPLAGELAHEYGHLLGLADRYSGGGLRITRDFGYGTKIMGKLGNKADAATIEEFFAANGTRLKARPGKTSLFNVDMAESMTMRHWDNSARSAKEFTPRALEHVKGAGSMKELLPK